MFAGRVNPRRRHRRQPERLVHQHRLLNLARHFEIALERHAVRHLEHDQQIGQEQAYDDGRGAHAGHDAEHAEDGQDDGEGEQRAARRREAKAERDEKEPDVPGPPLVPRQRAQRLGVDPPREVLVGVARVPREEALDVFGTQIACVRVVEAAPDAIFIDTTSDNAQFAADSCERIEREL